MEDSEMISTFVYVRQKPAELWSHTQGGWVTHRKDLSDLAPPYLEAVQEALKLRKEING